MPKIGVERTVFSVISGDLSYVGGNSRGKKSTVYFEWIREAKSW
jgi:hypothetical protein